MAKFAFDINGTIDANPVLYESLMSALMAAGHDVVVLTGCSEPTPTQADVAEKAHLLNTLGVGHCYKTLVVFGDPPHKAKAKWCKKNGVDMLIDNSVKNAQLAAKYCTVLLPFATKTD